MAIRAILSRCFLAGALMAAGCTPAETGPIVVSAIGGAPELVNPNLQPLDPPRALVAEAAGQGLVRFDAAGEIEPALAQSWIVSDDGLRYTFRIRRTEWQSGGRVTAEQVVTRLRAAFSRASRNRLKPSLGLIQEVTPMTEEVLEITLKSPRPHFLQLLAQPEMAILRQGSGTGPYRAQPRQDTLLLSLPAAEEEEYPEAAAEPPILLRGERAAAAIARFAAGRADLIVGGSAGDLPILRAAQIAAPRIVFDPVAGLFGLSFARIEGVLADPAARRALAMAIDRPAIISALAVPNLQARESLVPRGIGELPQPAVADWAALPLPARRELAARTMAELTDVEPLTVRVAMPEGPGYRLVFAHLRRDWSAIGVTAELAAPGMQADLIFIDEVAPVSLAAWYLRNFTCDRARVCSQEADSALEAARTTATPGSRQALLAQADRALTEVVPFIAIAAPVRWSLVSPRLTGFRPNVFARHSPLEYIAREP
jgi:peptide/nickel transport system substrate-binding protein